MPRRPDWVDDQRYPFQDRWLDVAGHRLHYVDEGEGPTLLFLHGNPTWSFLWRDVIVRLRDRFRCVAPDHPGFGLSRPAWGHAGHPAALADAVEAFLLRLDLDDVVIVVHDWGGPIGFAVAARRPERIRGAVVSNTWAWPVGGDRVLTAFSRALGGRLGRRLVRRFDLIVNLVVLLGLRRHRATGAVLRHYRGPFRVPEDRRLTAELAAAITGSDELLAEAARGLALLRDRPALLVWGDRDPAFRRAHRRRFEHALPRHRTVVVHGAGHLVPEDAPEAFADAVARWAPAVAVDA